MHYHDLQSEEDKIIHILSAAKQNNIYGKAIIECVNEFGEDKTHAAIQKFKSKYRQTYERF